ncbi:hypothetical protein [Prevotella sp. kh1p2]|uniref:hypothetical protein n=1 Tax=Prevotella sp. kh1p2 TaxID=1761883 RepID=UPI0008B83222|nr:hypothetical protein [Prevotella sp. kh1p2]SES62481.1 hypothetical protein SAMN04487825_10128 [Prevotella sp. kh1p2]SNU10226.1 hypothetical protein SAMN06298210_101258 [Prevotellaceae bacterium KH2P17]
MFLTDEELALIERAKEYLYAFLSEFGEFLPFTMLMQGDEIFPLEHEVNEKSSTPAYLINMYEEYFCKERKDNAGYQVGLLCIDISIRSKTQTNRRSGIEYRLFGTDCTKSVIQYYQIKKDKTVLFEEMVGWGGEEKAIHSMIMNGE